MIIFTFGQTHMTNYPLPCAGRLSDFYVEVLEDDPIIARKLFIDNFTSLYCPRPMQFATSYALEDFAADYFKGRLCTITAEGELIK